MLRSDVAGASPEYVDYFLFLPLVVQCIFCIHANGKKREKEFCAKSLMTLKHWCCIMETCQVYNMLLTLSVLYLLCTQCLGIVSDGL